VLYFHNASPVLLALYNLIAPFIDPVTRSRVVFLPHDGAAAAARLAADMDLAVGAGGGGRGGGGGVGCWFGGRQ
jgi:hypothetical protein